MISVDIKKALSGIAPVLSKALGGTFAGQALQVISNVFGLGPDAKEEAVAAALAKATPEELLKLKQADYEFSIEVLKLDVEDRASARARQIALKDWVPSVLAFINLGAFVTVLYAMFTHAIPDSNRTVFDILLGILGGSMTTIMAYYFGSSQGSQAKDVTIAKALHG